MKHLLAGTILTFLKLGVDKTDKELLKQLELLKEENASLRSKLENSEQKYSMLMQNSPTGIITINSIGEILSANKRLLDILGSPSEEETKKINMLTFKPLVDIGVSRIFKECLSKGEIIISEVPYISKWGKKSFLRYQAAPIFGDSGEIRGVQATVEDFTSKKAIEKKLKESEEHFRKITENMLDLVSLTDAMGNFVYISPSHIATLGFTEEDMLGKNVFDFIHPEEKDETSLAFTEMLAKKTHGEEVFRYKHKSGHYLWLETVGRVLTNEEGEIVNLIFVSRDVSLRVKTEALLNESREQFEAFINSSADMIFLKDLNFRHLIVNKRYAQFVGKKLNEIIGKDDFDLLPQNLAFECRESDQEVIRKNKSIIFEEAFNGMIFESKKFPVWIKDELIGIGALIRDVTTERKAVRDLKNSELRNRSILDALPDIMFVLDFMGNFIDYHTNNKEKLLVEPEFFIHKNVSEVLPDEVSRLTKETINRTIETNETQIYSYSLKIKGKTEYYEGRMVKCGENEVMAVIRDITEQEKAQRKLIESEQRFREFAELLPEVAFEVNKDGLLTFVNKIGLEKFGIQAAILVKGVHPSQFFTEESAQRLNASIEQNLNGNSESGNEYEAITKKGKTFPCLIYNGPIKENNEIIGLRGILIDISGLKKAQSLKNEIRIAEKSSQLKQQFLANMSHEMRTPMNGIIGMTEFLLQTDLNEQQREYTNIIHSSSESLLYLINEILDISKIEQGKLKLVPVNFSLKQTIKEVLDNFSNLIQNRPLKIITKFQQNLPDLIYNDVNRVKQVLSNLISNAIKYTKEGYIEIKCFYKERTNTSYDITIEVIDTGQGISTENQERIFQLFSRLDDSLTRSTEGTGLGLAIAKKMAELLQGNITVESEVGEGSRFIFTFAAERSLSSGLKIVSKKTVEVNLGLNVLYAEDKLVNQKVLELILKSIGCKVVMANNGRELLSLYKENTYDVILMDIMMPEMDGITAMKELRRKYKELPPIIGLSANAMEGDADKYIAEGMDDYIVKPVKREILFMKLSAIKSFK